MLISTMQTCQSTPEHAQEQIPGRVPDLLGAVQHICAELRKVFHRDPLLQRQLVIIVSALPAS